MAKFRFPGKALKLNSRKRVKFRCADDENPDEQRILQIKSGLLLFNQLFGDSDEEDEDDEFIGFGSHAGSKLKKKRHVIKQFNSVDKKLLKKTCDTKNGTSLPDDKKEDVSNIPSNLINGSVGNSSAPIQETVILVNESEDGHGSKVNEDKKNSEVIKENTTDKSKEVKKSKENGERTSKKFILPSVSVRSARIIKPNKRLFSDFTSICSTNQHSEESKPIVTETVNELDQKVEKVKQNEAETENSNADEERECDPVCRSITFYTDSITEEFKGQVGRPPKRILKKGELPYKEEIIPPTIPLSPSKGPKEEKVKEKIEKLLRSPWDNRIKQTKAVGKEKDQTSISLSFNNSRISKSILRKARLNLNKQTLQKIRSPASVQRLVPLSEEETAENKCGLCQNISCNTICRYGVSCCEPCHMSINFFTENFSSNLDCVGGQGECQMFGLPIEEKCLGCWLCRILVTCAMPSLLHDRLRNYLPPVLREKIPTSLGRSSNLSSTIQEDEFGESGKGFSSDSTRNFGLLVDLPGGWKRKNGSEVIVISPSGEKFKSISKLEEYLKRQGINAQASVLFGNLNSKSSVNEDGKISLKHVVKPHGKINNVVVTTLPGGWTRRIRWRNSGDKFDTYVCSPDGRTFKSRKELSSYFQHIGKVDDIYKYFPVKNSSVSRANSSENSEASSTEPISSPEISTEENSPHISESEGEELSVVNCTSESVHMNRASKDTDECKEKIEKTTCEDNVSSSKNSDLPINDSGTLIISNFIDHKNKLNKGNVTKTNENDDSVKEGTPPSPLTLPDLSSKGESTLSSLSDTELENVSAGVNLRMLKKSHKHKKSKKKSNKKKRYDEGNEKSLILKVKSLSETSLDKQIPSSKHKKKKKKKKHKHEKVSKEDLEKEKIVVGNADSITPSAANNENHNSASLEENHSLLSSNSNKGSTQPNVSYFNEGNMNITCHPNDTWQTLICSGVSNPNEESHQAVKVNEEEEIFKSNFDKDEGNNHVIENETCLTKADETSFKEDEVENQVDEVGSEKHFKKVVHESKKKDDVENNPKKSGNVKSLEKAEDEKCVSKVEHLDNKDNSTFKLPDLTKIANLSQKNSVNRKTKKITKLSGFTTQHFGNGWSRKIKWNDKGQGKVSYLTSPDGQKIVSSIELMAYFKKAGKSLLDIEYYFPKDLVRELPKEEEPITELSNEEALKRLSPALVDKVEQKRGRIVYKQPKTKCSKRALKLLHQIPVKRLNAELKSPKSNTKDSSILEDGVLPNCDTNLISDGGPRVKHVCRSQAQVLGMPRAVFPSPEKKTPLKKKVVYSARKAKYLSVITPKGRRVLKKTIWCNKCRGCITPNCRKCVHCLDMKKYGGPGTKKKPCVMRKCLNPTRAIKYYEEISPSLSQSEEVGSEEKKIAKSNSENVAEQESISVPQTSLDHNSDFEFSDLTIESLEDKKTDETEEVFSSPERSIFVPKFLSKPSLELKDKGDIQAGKECTPGTRVNIDYWQPYDAEEMLISGFPIITSVPLQIDSFCFRCGSAGMEQLLYCIWCCEGVHPFCLEEGEGPENDDDEMFWVCKKCAVCHVCGGSGHYDLHQCSGCRKHYHLECLGPSAHLSCQPTQDGIWVSDALHLLSLSWPKQTPIIDMTDHCIMDSASETVTLIEELENLNSLHEIFDNEIKAKEEIALLPSAIANSTKLQFCDVGLPSPEKKKNILIESVHIEDTFADLEEEDHICLEDTFTDLEDIVPLNSPTVSNNFPNEEEVVRFIRDVNLYDFKPSKEGHNFVTMEDDEYLSLKYKKILPYRQSAVESSLLKILHIIHSEVSEALGYSLCKNFQDKLSAESVEKQMSEINVEVPNLDEENSMDLQSVVQIRRAEVQQAIKNLEDLRVLEEKRIREVEREKARKRRLESLLREKNEKEMLKFNRRKLKPKKMLNNMHIPIEKTSIDEYFVEYKNESQNNWQPRSWEEFDALFSTLSEKNPKSNSLLEKSDKVFFKRKRGRPKERFSPGQRKAKRLKLSQCSVKVTRLELRKWKMGRKSLSPRKSPLKKVFKSPKKVSNLSRLFIDKKESDMGKDEGSCSKGTTLKNSLGNSKICFQQRNHDRTISNSSEIPLISADVQGEHFNDNSDKGERKDSSVSMELKGLDCFGNKEQINEIQLDQEKVYVDALNNSDILDSTSTKEERSSTRPRRISYGRASELASLRKAMMDN